MKFEQFLFVVVVALACSFGISAQDSFESLDSNGDGKLDLIELGVEEPQLSKVDANNDGFLDSREYRDYRTEKGLDDLRTHMNDLVAGLRTSYIRYSSFPKSLESLVERKILAEVKPDPWATPFELTLSGEQQVNRRPAKPTMTMDEDSVVHTSFMLKSAGPDRSLNTEDDIIRSPSAFRSIVTESRRKVLIREAGEEYLKAKEAWSRELAFRVWQEIAMRELVFGDAVEDLGDLALPESIFPEGLAIDAFGRDFSLRHARGLRAVFAPEIPGTIGTLIFSEAEFIDQIKARSGSDRYYGSMDNLARIVGEFLEYHGRLPVTMPELRNFGGSNQWIFRQANAQGLLYMTINGGKGFVVMELGYDNEVGGRGGNRDRFLYDEGFDTSDIWRRVEYSYGRDKDRFRTVRVMNAVALAAKELAAAKSDSASSDVSERLRTLGDDDRKTLRSLVAEAVKEKKAQEEKAAKEAEEAKKAEEASKASESNPSNESETPEEEKPEDGAARDDAPSKKEESKPEGGEGKEENEQNAGTAFQPSILMTANLQEAESPASAKEEVEGEDKAEDGTKDESSPDPAEGESKEEVSISHSRDMVPRMLYSYREADEEGFFGGAQQWTVRQYMQQVERLRQEAVTYSQRSDKDTTMPCGNIDLSNSADFLKTLDTKSWEEVEFFDGEPIFEGFVISRFERDEYRNVLTLVVIGIPEKSSNMPYMISSIVNSTYHETLFSPLSAQPEGWHELLLKCNGAPELQTSGTEDASSEKAPSDKSAEKEKGEAGEDSGSKEEEE